MLWYAVLFGKVRIIIVFFFNENVNASALSYWNNYGINYSFTA